MKLITKTLSSLLLVVAFLFTTISVDAKCLCNCKCKDKNAAVAEQCTCKKDCDGKNCDCKCHKECTCQGKCGDKNCTCKKDSKNCNCKCPKVCTCQGKCEDKNCKCKKDCDGKNCNCKCHKECACQGKCNDKNCKCKDKKKESLVQKTFERPWGTYTVIAEGNGYLIKTITVKPDQKLSVQRHNHRGEHWFVLEGTAKVIKGDKEVTLKEGEAIDIGVKEIHSLQNPYKTTLTIMEVQKGDIIDENDIERLSDIYGRK